MNPLSGESSIVEAKSGPRRIVLPLLIDWRPMTATVTAAFVHHAAAFLLVAALMVELVVLKNELTLTSARSVLRMDRVYGIAALVLLVVGFVRVFHTEKGMDYYFSSGPFLVKLALFILVGVLSISPTIRFLGWRKALREGRVPDLDDGARRKVRTIIHVELTLVFIIMLMAVMMARGVWYLG
jgi:putative membrane protein